MNIAVLTNTSDLPAAGSQQTTSFGLSDPIQHIIIQSHNVVVTAYAGADPRATIHAWKDAGCTHVLLGEGVAALSPLLEPDDWVVPHDYIDATHGLHYTTFTQKAGGYVQQSPAFDPALRTALLQGLCTQTSRPFQRGVYVSITSTRFETPAEAHFWERAGGHLAGRLLSPYLTLARELEMATAAVCRVTRHGGEAESTPLRWQQLEPVIEAVLEQWAAPPISGA
jgi:5'-methylthioadenosine phosphorylase